MPFWQVYYVFCVWGFHSGWLEPEQFTALCESQNCSACFFQVVLIPFLPCFWRSVLNQRPEGTHLQSTLIYAAVFLSAPCHADSSCLVALKSELFWIQWGCWAFFGFLHPFSAAWKLFPGSKLELLLCFPSQRDHLPAPTVVQCLKTVVLYIFS